MSACKDRDKLLNGETLPAGHYDRIRLTVNNATLVVNKGGTYPLTIPSAAQTGLKLASGFDVSFTIDFDFRKFVHMTGGPAPVYMLKPVLRLVNNLQVFAISGALANTSGCTSAVYVCQNAYVTPDDPESATPPLTTAIVGLDSGSGACKYTAAFLEAGDYTGNHYCCCYVITLKKETGKPIQNDMNHLALHSTRFSKVLEVMLVSSD